MTPQLSLQDINGLPGFPGTSWRRQLKNEEYLDKKREKLHAYMVRLLAHNKAAVSPILSRFLEVHNEDSGQNGEAAQKKPDAFCMLAEVEKGSIVHNL